MKWYRLLLATSLTGLVSSQAGATYKNTDAAINLDKVALSNRADCSKEKRDFDSLYKDFTLLDSAIVNTTKTPNCRSPVGATPLRGLSGDNIIYGDNIVTFLVGSGLMVKNTLFNGSVAFDVSVDIDSLKLAGDFGMELEVKWIRGMTTIASDKLTFSVEKDGQPPYKVNLNKKEAQADTFTIWAHVLDDGAWYLSDFKLALFNLDFGLLVRDEEAGTGMTSSEARPRPTATRAASTTSSSPGRLTVPTSAAITPSRTESGTTASAATPPTSTPNSALHRAPSFGMLAALLISSALL